MEKLFYSLAINFSNFYSELNDVGKLVFFISILLFLILIVLVIIMVFQKSIRNKIEIRQLKILKEDEERLEKLKDSEALEELIIDDKNTKTKDLQNIVSELKKASIEEREDSTDTFEDEQEKNAVISYEELIKMTNETVLEPIEEVKQKKQEVFSSVFTPNQEPIYKASKDEKINTDYDNSETFLQSLKEFRKNL
jgi:hypothetical protein